MNKDKYVFASLASFLDRNHFKYLARKYLGDRYIKSFSCWNQLLSMMFGQLCNRDGLRDLVVALEAHQGKLYHLGMGKSVTRSNLSKANENRANLTDGIIYGSAFEGRSDSRPVTTEPALCPEDAYRYKGIGRIHEITLGGLADMISSFKEVAVDTTSDSLTEAMYATYLSFVPSDDAS